MKQEKKYYVYLTHSGMISTCGSKQMTESEIEAYLKEIMNGYAEIPQSSCLYSLQAAFNHSGAIRLCLGNNWSSENNFSRTSSGVFSIRIDLKDCSKCHSSKCLENIETGRCDDDCVRVVIGEKLFPDKYVRHR